MSDMILVNNIVVNPDQPRTVFSDAEIYALAESMAEYGLLQPVSVTGPYDNRYYILNDGERRFRAAKQLGWTQIPAHIRAPEEDRDNGHSRLILALIGNLQRTEMGVVDEARAFRKLRESGMSTDEIAHIIGKSSSTVHNRLNLLDGDLTPATLEHLNVGRIPNEYSMLRMLKRLQPEQQDLIVKRAIIAGSSAQSIRTAISRMINQTPIPRRNLVQSKRHTLNGVTAPALAVNDVELPERYIEIGAAVIPICEHCGMGTDKTGAICRDCPLSALMVRLSKE